MRIRRIPKLLILAVLGAVCALVPVAATTATADPGAFICNNGFNNNGYVGQSFSDVTVPGGDSCTLGPGTTVSHDVTVEPGGSLFYAFTTVGHDVVADQPAEIEFLGGTIDHDLVVNGLTGPAATGSHIAGMNVGHDLVVENTVLDNGATDCTSFFEAEPGPACDLFLIGGATVGHDLTVVNNVGDAKRLNGSQVSVIVGGSTVGHDLTVENNAGADVGFFTAFGMGNSAGHDAICQNNGTQDGGGNTAKHLNSCPT